MKEFPIIERGRFCFFFFFLVDSATQVQILNSVVYFSYRVYTFQKDLNPTILSPAKF